MYQLDMSGDCGVPACEVLDSALLGATTAEVDNTAEKMRRLVHAVRTQLEPVECPVYHHFSPGVYARELRIPAGSVIVGKIHKHDNMLIMSAGEAEISIDGQVARVKAPHISVGPAGSQRAAYTITDCVFISVHGTHETDLDKIEKEFIAQDALEYEQYRLAQAAIGA